MIPDRRIIVDRVVYVHFTQFNRFFLHLNHCGGCQNESFSCQSFFVVVERLT